MRWALGLIFGLVAAIASPAQAERLALVVGNADYAAVPALKTAASDAQLIAATLTDLGFDVVLVEDATRRALDEAIAQVAGSSKDAEAVVFYFSGHGFRFEGTDYLVPIDATLKTPSGFDAELVKVDAVMAALANPARPALLFIDTSRDNPLPPSQRDSQASGSVAATSLPPETYVLYATSAGNVAFDGKGAHGPFAQALDEALRLPDETLAPLVKLVRSRVAGLTDNNQQPAEQSSLTGDFLFNAGQSAAVVLAGFEDAQPAPLVKKIVPTTDIAVATPESEGQVPPTTVTVPVPTITAPPTTTTAAPDPVQLAELIQSGLKDTGCYTGTIDGNWGSGSQRALKRYYDAGDVDLGDQPTQALLDRLKQETGIVCEPVRPTTPTADVTPSVKPTPTPSTPTPTGKPKIKLGTGSGTFR